MALLLRQLLLLLALLPGLLSGRAEARVNASKYQRITSFVSKGGLSQMRGRVSRTLAGGGSDSKVAMAAIVRIMDKTGMRVGSYRYTTEAFVRNKTKHSEPSYGASTLQCRHVTVRGDTVHFNFMGKAGVHWDPALKDTQLAKVIVGLKQGKAPNDYLFVSKGAKASTLYSKVSRYIHSFVPAGTPKQLQLHAHDLRGLRANLRLIDGLLREGKPTSSREAGRIQKKVIGEVAQKQYQTAAVCRSRYLCKDILDSHAAGGTLGSFGGLLQRQGNDQ